MGLLDIFGTSGTQRGGMSPLTMALLGVLAYRTMKGKGRLADIFGMNPNTPATAPAGAGGGILGGLGPLGGLLGGGAGGILGGGAGGILSGGLGDLLRRFQENGHGDKAQSWIASGANTPIAPGELEEALGPERVQWLMQQTGMSKDELMSGLSARLPQVVDKLTPDGRLPSPEEAERLL
jgi:uncharacterized protein YidB (DUF937 family)